MQKQINLKTLGVKISTFQERHRPSQDAYETSADPPPPITDEQTVSPVGTVDTVDMLPLPPGTHRARLCSVENTSGKITNILHTLNTDLVDTDMRHMV